MTTEKKPLSDEDALRLLDLLCSDDAFRTLFSSDPATALAQISTEAGAASVECVSAGPLASKAEFEQARTQLLQHLAAQASFNNPHCFVAEQIDACIRRAADPQ